MYELVGAIVDREELTGNENIGELVQKFTLKRKLFTGDLMPNMERYYKKEIKKKQAKILNKLEEILTGIYMPSEIEAVNEAADKLLKEYVCSEFGEKYDLISSDMFELKRKIDVEVAGQKDPISIPIEIPLFISGNFGSTKPWEYKEVKTGGYKNQTIQFAVSIPPLTPEIKKQAREAKAYFQEFYAKALRTKLIGDLLMKDINRFRNGGGLDLNIYWIPKASELDIEVEEEIIDPDPLLVGELYNNKYLIAAWNVEGEEPYEHYLKEFKL